MRRFMWSAVVLLVAAVAGRADEAHVFRFDPPANDARSVALAGTFNGWSRDATPMRDGDGDGVYEVKVILPDGVHYYKFVVNGDRWLNDPRSDTALERGDGHGGVNSAILIGPDARDLPDPRPNHVNPDGIVHSQQDPAQLSVASDGLVRLGIKVQAGDVQHAAAAITSDAQPVPIVLELHRIGSGMGFDIFGGMARVPGDAASYVFTLRDGDQTLRFGASGAFKTSGASGEAVEPFTVSLDPRFVTPAWAASAVWYQIFPERFRNGNPRNDPENTFDWDSDWWATLPGETPGPQNFYTGDGNVWQRRFGGDIQGVAQALPYLRRLGVNAIYFNPVFEAESMHKYDASDLRHIDDNFGIKGDLAKLQGETADPATWRWTTSDRLFLDFLDEAHRQGFKVIIDGVFNHVGREFWAFQDVLENGRDSKYADWFDITDWGRPGGVPGEPGGIQWNAWDGHNGYLPTLRKDAKLGLAPGPREHIMAITRRWMNPVVDGVVRDGIDGWRLDVPQDIPHPFWRDWRKLVKSLDPDALIVGEIWGDASPWLGGDQFDAVMNYPFAMIAQDFFADQETAISPGDFLNRLTELFNRYPLPAALVQLNLFDSHDTDRFASMFVNPDRNYDQGNRLQDGADYSDAMPDPLDWRRMRQALVCQMTYAGAPMLYYGTEAGMWSPDDPSNRQPMIWPDLLPYDDPRITFRADLFQWCQRLIAIRRALEPLRHGYFRPMLADNDAGVAAYARDLGDRHVYVVLNRSKSRRHVTLPRADADHGKPMVNWLDESQARVIVDGHDRPRIEAIGHLMGADDALRLDLAPYSSMVISQAPQ